MSGLTGYMRDASIAASLGASRTADAFMIAYSWLDLLIAVLGVTLAAAIVPTLAAAVDATAKRKMAAGILSVLSAMGLVVTVGILLVAPIAAHVLAPGLGPDDQNLTAGLMRIMAPAVLAVTFSAGCAAVLNAHLRFAAPSLGPVLYNLVLSAGAIVSRDHSAWTIAVAATAAAMTQALAMAAVALRLRLLTSLDMRALKDAAASITSLLPLLAGSMISYFAIFADRAVASGFRNERAGRMTGSRRPGGSRTKILDVFLRLATSIDGTLARPVTTSRP